MMRKPPVGNGPGGPKTGVYGVDGGSRDLANGLCGTHGDARIKGEHARLMETVGAYGVWSRSAGSWQARVTAQIATGTNLDL